MTIVVDGWCAREPDPSATEAVTGYRDQLPTRPVISGTKRAPVVMTDHLGHAPGA
jgi:hypothetical protein